MANHHAPALLDAHGRPFLYCAACRAPLSAADLAEFGLRAPDFGETLDEYCEAELVATSELRHRRCLADEARSV